MSRKQEIIRQLLEPGVIAIIRADSSAHLLEIATALHEGGIGALEVTMTTPNAIEAIAEITGRFPKKLLVGVGTVLDPETARAAILTGADFVVTPVSNPRVIKMCARYGKPIVSGAMTPTEALATHEAGADFVKLFPADNLGPQYVRNLLAPLPMLQIIPTGGVTPESAGEYLRAGCVAVGAGSTLVTKEAIRNSDWQTITETATRFVEAVRQARS
jgi:2-dehydro-3-deoxyphosphogluconate aldolase/(4S)-4-hydroxy-2-oxoglutarate aldolase